MWQSSIQLNNVMALFPVMAAAYPCLGWAAAGGHAGLGWAGLRFSAFYLQHNSETFFEHSSRHRHFELLGKDMEIKWDEWTGFFEM